MNLYLRAGQRTWHSIREHPWKTLLVILLQFGFLISVVGILLHYSTAIFSQATELIGKLPTAMENTGSASVLNPSAIAAYQSYQSLRHTLIIAGLWLLLATIFLQGRTWLGTYSILFPGKGVKHTITKMAWQWLWYTLATMVTMALFLIAAYTLFWPTLLFSDAMNPSPFTAVAAGSLFIIIETFYLLLLGCIPLVHRHNVIQKIVTVARKIYLVIPPLCLFTIIIFGSAYWLYYNLEHGQLLLTTLSSILFIFMLVLYKLYWVAFLYECTIKNTPSEK